eukprot:15363924-Heterocapsa_arctica.AAC.1
MGPSRSGPYGALFPLGGGTPGVGPSREAHCGRGSQRLFGKQRAGREGSPIGCGCAGWCASSDGARP